MQFKPERSFSPMKHLLLTGLLLLALPVWANMASPNIKGDTRASAFLGRHVAIERETLTVTPDAEFATARFAVSYHIVAEKSGVQVPLLFYAPEYRDDFSVQVDGQPVALRRVPEGENQVILPAAFSDSLGNAHLPQLSTREGNFAVRPEDLLYFETDLSEGPHHIAVSYTANPWTDRSDWTNSYSFFYALSPAAYWKSYGQLTVRLDARACQGPVTASLGAPDSGSLASVAVWHFDALPAEDLSFGWQPQPTGLARYLIWLGPDGILYSLAVLLAALHLAGIWQWRRRNATVRRLPGTAWLGMLLVPLLAIAAYSASFGWIDSLIGPHASGYHGYGSFLIWGTLPVALPLYTALVWGIDRLFWRKKR